MACKSLFSEGVIASNFLHKSGKGVEINHFIHMGNYYGLSKIYKATLESSGRVYSMTITWTVWLLRTSCKMNNIVSLHGKLKGKNGTSLTLQYVKY